MKKLSLIFFLFAVSITALNAQSEHSGMGMAAPGVVAKPSFETNESGLHLKIWIMSIIDDEIYTDTNKVQNSSENDEKHHGTHQILAEIRDASEGKELKDANVKVELLSPSGKTDIVDLETVSNQYGGELALDEKGEYKLKLNVSTPDGRDVKAPFSYKVR